MTAPEPNATLVVPNPDALVENMIATFVSTELLAASPTVRVNALVVSAMVNKKIRPADGTTTDGYHTFDELYRHRMLLTAALFGVMDTLDEHFLSGRGHPFNVHKSRLHSDGTMFEGGWFIVVAQLPTGQISYHYLLEHWDLFDIPERERAAAWDGHTSEQAADRLQEWLENES